MVLPVVWLVMFVLLVRAFELVRAMLNLHNVCCMQLAEQVSGNTAAAPLEQLESLTAVVAVVTHFMTSLNELLGDR